MKNLMKKIRKSNKGFTLVELIIVVAIIAILTAVVAPQYLKYVERSRYGTDMNALGEVAHAAEVAKVGTGFGTPPAGDTVTVTTTGAIAYGTSDLETAVAEMIPAGSYTFQSTAFKGAASITITIDDDGHAEYTAPAAP